MPIADNIRIVKERIAAAAGRAGRDPKGITLVAVSKGHDASLMRVAFEAGQRVFGENRVQEAEAKLAQIADFRGEIELHMVGHLQTNKVKNSVHTFDIIESVDSVRLGDSLARRVTGRMTVFLEVNVSGERSKSGLLPVNLEGVLNSLRRYEQLDVCGLMTMAPHVVPEKTRPVFRRLRELSQAYGLGELSMGMTNDFEVAIEEGATVVRVGTAIFGTRS